ncbi:hypothetical protein LCGC14_0219860 [marine sediment metagenome]|uniref:DUF4406 domain-containing protein n=1 Tax=marine sediment metagenome TaxID=412755 RepID=A0A0F9WXH5_9ZZZZ
MFGIKKKYDFYVGGPMRGYKNLNKAMFAMVAHILRTKGFTVWSPSEHDGYLKLSFAQCMTVDLNAVINQCRKIVLLPGWKDSLGANMEAFSAFACGKEAVEVVPNENNTDFDLEPLSLSEYRLPYQTGKTRQFNPHECDLDSFEPTR